MYSQDVFRDIFYQFNPEQPIRISAQGDWGPNVRNLHISMQKMQKRRQDQHIVQQGPTRPESAELNVSLTESEDEIVFHYTHDDEHSITSRAWWYERVISHPVLGSSGTTETGIHEEPQRLTKRPNSTFMAAANRESEQSVASRLGSLQLQGTDQEILHLLRYLEPDLQSLSSITIGNRSVVHASIEGLGRPIPVRSVGEGFNRMLELVLSMDAARGGHLLVDEIENGLHHSALKDVFTVLSDFAQQLDVQIFATTHSAECIEAAHQALSHKDECEIAIYRLDRTQEHTKAVRFDREMLNTAMNFDLEIR